MFFWWPNLSIHTVYLFAWTLFIRLWWHGSMIISIIKPPKLFYIFIKKNKDIYIHTHTHSWSQNFTHTFQNLLNVNYFTKIRGIIQIACYFVFSTDLNKIYKNTGKPENSWDLKDFSRRTADSLTVQDKQGTHEQLSLNKNTQLWIIQGTTQY